MPLIKSNHAPVTLSPFSMKDVENHAKGVLLRSQQQAEALLVAAQEEAALLKEQATAEGFADGQERGLQAGMTAGRETGKTAALEEHRASLTAALNALNNAMTELNESRRALETRGLADVIELSIAIARRVTKRQCLIDPDVLIDNLNDAMKLVVHASDLRVAIHPTQRATLDDAMPVLRVSWPALEHAAIVDDATLAPGGVRVFTRQGRVDADIDGQLDRVVGELLPVPTQTLSLAISSATTT